MASLHASLLQLRAYLVAYLTAASTEDDPQRSAAVAELRDVIAELQDLQKHPELRVRVERLGATLSERAERLRASGGAQPAAGAAGATMARAFERYIDEVNAYVQRNGEPNPKQLGLMIGELVADLKVMALSHDEQLLSLAADIDERRAQLLSSQRPWQAADRVSS